MTTANSVSLLQRRGRLLSVAAAAGLVSLLSTATPQPAGAGTITAQGAVTALTNVSQMGLNPTEAGFDEPGMSDGDPMPLGTYSGLGLTFRFDEDFATIGILDRSGTAAYGPGYHNPGFHFGPPIAGGGVQTGLTCDACGVASLTNAPTRFGLTASYNGTQYLTVWDTAGYIIGQVTWVPNGDSAFVGLDTGGVRIGFVAYGNDDVWNGEPYAPSGASTFSDTWLWQACGNGSVDVGEQCDDGNADSGDCCDADCQFEGAASSCDGPADCEERACDGAGTCVSGANLAPGTPCEADASVCTIDQCDGTGNCLYVSDLDCDDTNPCTQDSCVPTSGCVNDASPATGCNTAGVASLMLSDPENTAKKKATFVWAKGTSALAAFGNIATTDYALCVYDGDGVVVRMTAPAASTCGTSPCWSMIGAVGKEKGVIFKDRSKIPEHDGVKVLVGKADDGVAGKAVVKLVAVGPNIPSMSLGSGLGAPVTAQILTNNAACWTAEFQDENASRNDGMTYKAKVKAD